MTWYSEYLWFADVPAQSLPGTSYRVCAIDAAGNEACSEPGPANDERCGAERFTARGRIEVPGCQVSPAAQRAPPHPCRI